MAKQKQKNLSPLELGHLKKYIDNQWCSLQELAVEMGSTVESLQSYIEALGGLNLPTPPPPSDELTPTQQRVRESFAIRSGAVIMTEGSSTLIEKSQGNKSFDNQSPIYVQPKPSAKQESAIFRGNKPLGAKGNPYDERRN